MRSTLGPSRVSERRACRVLNQSRATQRRVAFVPTDEPKLVGRMTALASDYGRYGYRRVGALLRQTPRPGFAPSPYRLTKNLNLSVSRTLWSLGVSTLLRLLRNK